MIGGVKVPGIGGGLWSLRTLLLSYLNGWGRINGEWGKLWGDYQIGMGVSSCKPTK